jgi:asparagine synthase (glutamine-hydrolysing)
MDAFSIVFDDPRLSEEKWIESSAATARVQSHRFTLGNHYALDQLSAAGWHLDQPLSQPNCIGLYLLAQNAREVVTVLLSGEGADELFGGYRWHAAAWRTWRKRRWHARLWPDVAPLRAIGRVARRLVPLTWRVSQEPFRHVADALARRREVRAAFVLDGGRRYLRQATLFRRLGETRGERAPMPREERAFLARCFDDFYIHLGTLLQSRNKMAFAESVEVRVPYLENELIDFGLHLGRWIRRRSKTISRWIAASAPGHHRF